MGADPYPGHDGVAHGRDRWAAQLGVVRVVPLVPDSVDRERVLLLVLPPRLSCCGVRTLSLCWFKTTPSPQLYWRADPAPAWRPTATRRSSRWRADPSCPGASTFSANSLQSG